MIALPDVNVLLALAWEPHLLHQASHAWFGQSASEGWATCILTQSACLRLSLNPQVVSASLEFSTALELLRRLTSHPNHQFVAESPSLTDAISDEMTPRIRGYRQMTDATLLIFARSHGLKLITFDQAIRPLSPWPESFQILTA